MLNTPYVQDHYIRLMRQWEETFRTLSPDAGILFVCIRAQAEHGGIPRVFEVILGMDRARFDENTGHALVKRYLAEELSRGTFEIRSTIYPGVVGRAACAHDGAGGAPEKPDGGG
jgi:hypothetical protein